MGNSTIVAHKSLAAWEERRLVKP